MADPVVPGPCPEEGCPPTTEIVCVETVKVYDFCFQADTNSDVSFTIPSSCPSPLPVGTTASGTVSSVGCTTIAVEPILNPSTGAPTGFANVTLLITVTVTFTLTGPTGTTLCTFTGQYSFMKTVVLCAPTGTTISCESPSSSVGPVVIVDDTVHTTVTICLLIESTALVKLLLPSYGYCTPAPCVVAPFPPFACPPSPLFPPQCAV